jgi:LPXTG-site transpeptidase (sortase) family protein
MDGRDQSADDRRAVIALVGDVMIAAALVGFVLLAVAMVNPALLDPSAAKEQAVTPSRAQAADYDNGRIVPTEIVPSSQVADMAASAGEGSPRSNAPAAMPRAMTRVRIPGIALDAEVVPSRYLERDGGSWEIPAFKVGHAERTGLAGTPGNAVLVGHATSIGAGHVFRDLDQVRVGDDLTIETSAQSYQYVVVDVRRVPRSEVSVLTPTSLPFVSLITCAGVWLPHLGDYTERLVVRAALVGLPA